MHFAYDYSWQHALAAIQYAVVLRSSWSGKLILVTTLKMEYGSAFYLGIDRIFF